MGLNTGWDADPVHPRRLLYLAVAALLVFSLLLARLWYLQVISGDRYRQLSEKNRIRYLSIPASRGPVLDRYGRMLIDNRPAFAISVLRQDVTDSQQLLENLSGYLHLPVEELLRRWREGLRLPPYRPVRLADDVSRDIMEQIQEHSGEMPGVLVEVHPVRAYPEGDLAAHLFGYVGEVTEKELDSLADRGYRPGDFVGKRGLEKELEPYLRGIDGERLLEVDVRGKRMRILQTREPQPGHRVFLTIDRDLQRAAEKAFGEESGAAVAIDVRTGEVLAFVNRPAFDPAQFARGISVEEWKRLVDDPRRPLQNKAISGLYPPGSTFKIVTALAALQAGIATPGTTIDCEGEIELGDRVFRCWKKKGHGPTDLKKALRESCDVWFYRVALELGIDRLSKMAFDLGLGAPTGIGLSGEKRGLIPTREWKRKRFGQRWYDGETVIAAIGQGYVLATPVQLAVMTAAIANGGKVLRPELVYRIETMDGEAVFRRETDVVRQVDLGARALQAVRRGLVAVVNEPHGTGWATRLRQIEVAGKTGTSQVVRRKSNEEEEREKDRDRTPWRFRDHALFVGYAPADEPRIAVAVVVEHGRHGSTAAAPIARAIFRSYFHLADGEEMENPGYLGD
ncbi:peptidoglycan glycosyltransferase [Geothermobacter ehrlichii]|uniref:Beta-lactamase n=1 Tax=Geothermobacter ehrlichii TaxID=213224 RepID=A0A5D3WIH7_9BACT|nr:penicillin-binding protein 2 [Geothermobacter ehrlichii]TYO98679.1 peptidoglycan glycosyltransferase [Geothermobacter ehrlichii]